MFILDALHFWLVVHSALELDSVEISVEFIIRHHASKNVFPANSGLLQIRKTITETLKKEKRALS